MSRHSIPLRVDVATRLLFSLSVALACLVSAAHAQPPGAVPDLAAEQRQRLAAAATDPALAPWQRGLMSDLARDGARAAKPLTASADGIWAQMFPPTGRRGHSAVYDPDHQLMLVFGGFQGKYLNDLWALHLDGAPTWERLTPSGTPPSPRAGHSAIWDSVRDRMVVFGGQVEGIDTFVNDLWALTFEGGGVRWTALPTSAFRPGARGYHAAVYDASHDRMMICQGSNNISIFVDVWLMWFGSGDWLNISPVLTPPVGRQDHVAVFDAPRNRLIIFGGQFAGTPRNDGWVLPIGGDWQPLTAAGPPSPRYGLSSFYDAAHDRMVIFGGRGSSAYFNETWALSLAGGGAWTQLTPVGTPPAARSAHTAAFDPTTDRMFVYGGSDGTAFFSDVTELTLDNGPEWSPLLGGDAPLPAPRNAHSAVFDPARGRMLIFGGVNGTNLLSDVATLSLALAEYPAWSPLAVSGTPPSARSSQSAIFDPVRDRVVMFGGISGGAALSDAWELTLAGTPEWAPLATSGAVPPGRLGHAAIYDPVRDRMLVLGGRSGPLYLSDVWALSLGDSPAWTPLSPSGTPPSARAFHAAVYDAARDRVVVFGGIGPSGHLNDVWALSLDGLEWTQLSLASPPPARQASAAIYDPVADRLVVFGGYDGNTLFDDAWALSLASTAWSKLLPGGTVPTSRTGSSAIYDPLSDRMLVFGGRTPVGSSNETWSLYFVGGGRLGVEPPGTFAGLWLAPARPNPSRGDAVIEFALPKSSAATLCVFDLSGRAVRTLVSGSQPAGRQSVRWDGRTASGSLARAGVYFYTLNVDGQRLTRRAVLMP